MTAPEILCACTYNGAAALGEEEKLGVLSPGRVADFLLWQTVSHPLGDDGVEVLEEIITRSSQPVVVFVGGRPTCG